MPKPELYVIFIGEKPENPPDIIPVIWEECPTIVTREERSDEAIYSEYV